MKIYSVALLGLMMSFNVAAGGNEAPKNYYLMEKGYTCTPGMLVALSGAERPKPIPSWKNRIKVVGDHVTEYGDACNDYGQGINIQDLKFSADKTKLIYKRGGYVYKAAAPFGRFLLP